MGMRLRGTQGLPKLHLGLMGAEKINTSTSLSCLTQMSSPILPPNELVGKELDITEQRHLCGAGVEAAFLRLQQAGAGEGMDLGQETESDLAGQQ